MNIDIYLDLLEMEARSDFPSEERIAAYLITIKRIIQQ